MKRYEWRIHVAGFGDTPEEAWDDCWNNFMSDRSAPGPVDIPDHIEAEEIGWAMPLTNEHQTEINRLCLDSANQFIAEFYHEPRTYYGLALRVQSVNGETDVLLERY